MKVINESEVSQLCLNLSDPTDYSLQAPPSMGFSMQEYWSGVPLPSPLLIPKLTHIFISLAPFWRKKWQPTPVFLPVESQGQRSLVGFRLWDRTESDTTEAT